MTITDELRAQLADFRKDFHTLRSEIAKVIVGQVDILDDLLIALLAGGHVLLEGVPGLGKTLTVRTLADALHLAFRRIQFTPDLMPADLIGTNIVVETPDGRKMFQFQRGPVFANVLLADEINRATPKTQSALLEAMQEHSVTVAGETHRLAPPFFVLATQNPIEMEGTYPLPEAQLDRFFCKLLVTPPPATWNDPRPHHEMNFPHAEPVLTLTGSSEMQRPADSSPTMSATASPCPGDPS
jgi:MoxR-like ATPase